MAFGPSDYIEWRPQDPRFLAWLSSQPPADIAEACAPCARATAAAAVSPSFTREPAPRPARDAGIVLAIGALAGGIALGVIGTTIFRRGRR